MADNRVSFFQYIVLACLIGIAALLWVRNWQNESDQNQIGQTVIARPADEVKDVPKIDVQVKAPVKVYKGGAALKDGLKLPKDIVDLPSAEVISSSKIDGRDDHPKTVTTVINTETGESQTYVRTDPLPWFAMSSRGGVGMYGGFKNGDPAVRLQAEQEIFTVKALHFKGVASIDQPVNGLISADYFVGVGAEYRW